MAATGIPLNTTGMSPFRLSLKITLLSLGVILLFCVSCHEKDPSKKDRSSDFAATPQTSPITPGIVNEASGIADSRNFDGYIWTHQDSGFPSELFLVSKDGKNIKKYAVPDTDFLDWEDITSGPGPQKDVNYLYIGDIGANAHPFRQTCTINRVREIGNPNDAFQPGSVEKIIFRYPDGPKDAETLLLDPVNLDLYVVSKETSRVNLYRLPYPQAVGSEITAELTGTIPGIKADGLPASLITSPTSGDISFDGKEIVIKTYTTIYYWKRGNGQTIGEVLTQPPHKTLPYFLEPEGTAICFDKKADGYFTLSEIGSAPAVTLNYYKRK